MKTQSHTRQDEKKLTNPMLDMVSRIDDSGKIAETIFKKIKSCQRCEVCLLHNQMIEEMR